MRENKKERMREKERKEIIRKKEKGRINGKGMKDKREERRKRKVNDK